MSSYDSKQPVLAELKNTNPQQLIVNNGNLENGYISHLLIVKQVFDFAQRLLDEFFAERQQAPLDASQDDPSAALMFPIPIRELADYCNFLLYETEMANQDSMEQDEQGGGRTTIAQMHMRERRIEDGKPCEAEIAGTIYVDKNLSESAKRFAIAHELGHYALRTLNPIGPLFIEDSCPGPFAYVPAKEFLANEFAYALLLPYRLVKERKKQYETENQYNPLNYIDWIRVLETEAQLPQYYVILGYEEIKKRQLVEADEIQEKLAKLEKIRACSTEIERLEKCLVDINIIQEKTIELENYRRRQLEEQRTLKSQLTET